MRYRVADAGAEVENPVGRQVPRARQVADDFDLVLGEVLRRLARDRDVGAMLLVLLVGEAVEFSGFHVQFSALATTWPNEGPSWLLIRPA